MPAQMNDKLKNYGLILLRLLLAAVFLAAGLTKLGGVEMMVATYEALGVGQWFRYVTGVIEIAAAILLFLPSKQVWGALLLVCTMIGAVLAHLLILGPSAVPAMILGILSAVILYAYRSQLTGQKQGMPDRIHQ